MLGLVPWLGHQFGTCHEVTSKTRVSSSDALVTTSSTTSKALVTTSEALVPSSFLLLLVGLRIFGVPGCRGSCRCWDFWSLQLREDSLVASPRSCWGGPRHAAAPKWEMGRKGCTGLVEGFACFMWFALSFCNSCFLFRLRVLALQDSVYVSLLAFYFPMNIHGELMSDITSNKTSGIPHVRNTDNQYSVGR